MTDPERDHLLARIDDLDRARRRWKLLALAGTPVLTVALALAVANAVTGALALRELVKREQQQEERAMEAERDAKMQAEEALMQADRARFEAERAHEEAEKRLKP
jgi:hypothetical protein